MTPTLVGRLTRLEAAQAGPVSAGPAPFATGTRLLTFLVAAHQGGLAPAESVAEALARVLGYDGPRAMRAALGEPGPGRADWSGRHAEAVGRLLRARGVDPAGGMDRVADGLRACLADVPEALRDHPGHPSPEGLETAVLEATEWLCL